MKVYGLVVDDKTRCLHYHTDKDIVALKFKCCNKYYPCFECHAACELHEPEVWAKNESDELAALCGICKKEHTITEYVGTNHCLQCGSRFNERCEAHYHLYFDV
ncbi:CHY zinc finger protein [Viridibacillus arvi]|uniref:CHY zinc finger protein n=1 Tax=Viridibacillus arvi TaxID=263475 RepID=UPI00187B2F57|nr:CHY zinc finger protein [Viridibacillus sp. JNUCC-6]QOV12017.1 hypothetical protein JNUCC6_04390 [Viridibacillus sp. JNUCC-6]